MRGRLTPPSPAKNRHAIVLGASPGTNNIGDNVCVSLYTANWQVTWDDCAVGDGSRPPGGNLPNDDVAREHGYNVTDAGRYQRFEVPSLSAFQSDDADALVVTLGSTYKDHFADLSQHDMDRVLRACLLMPLEAARRYVQAAEARMDRKLRRIVFVGSYAHRHPFTNGTAYCAAKAGLEMAGRALGWELTDRDYRVHVVHPFHVNGTPMWTQVEKDVMASKGMSWEEADAYNRKDLKMPDLLAPVEVAEVIRLLLTEPAMEWLSGTSLELFGGTR